MRKIAIIGPESTGKTELAQRLAEYYQCNWVPEYSREYLNNLSHPYEKSDLLEIAKGQLQLLEEYAAKGGDYLFADTDMHVMKVWSDYKYHETDPWILEELEKQDYDLYILTYHDIPYEEDPLRENPEERAYFFDIYQNLLVNSGRPFLVVTGDRQARLRKAVAAIKTLL